MAKGKNKNKTNNTGFSINVRANKSSANLTNKKLSRLLNKKTNSKIISYLANKINIASKTVGKLQVKMKNGKLFIGVSKKTPINIFKNKSSQILSEYKNPNKILGVSELFADPKFAKFVEDSNDERLLSGSAGLPMTLAIYADHLKKTGSKDYSRYAKQLAELVADDKTNVIKLPTETKKAINNLLQKTGKKTSKK